MSNDNRDIGEKLMFQQRISPTNNLDTEIYNRYVAQIAAAQNGMSHATIHRYQGSFPRQQQPTRTIAQNGIYGSYLTQAQMGILQQPLN